MYITFNNDEHHIEIRRYTREFLRRDEEACLIMYIQMNETTDGSVAYIQSFAREHNYAIESISIYANNAVDKILTFHFTEGVIQSLHEHYTNDEDGRVLCLEINYDFIDYGTEPMYQ